MDDPVLRVQSQLTDRDRVLLGRLCDHGVLTTFQIAHALFGSLDFGQRRLLALYRLRLIAARGCARETPAPPGALPTMDLRSDHDCPLERRVGRDRGAGGLESYAKTVINRASQEAGPNADRRTTPDPALTGGIAWAARQALSRPCGR